MINKIKKWVEHTRTKGVYFPFIRDPKVNKGSVSLTLVMIATCIVIWALIAKEAVFMEAMQFFWTSVSLYWGRKFQKDGDKVTLEKQD